MKKNKVLFWAACLFSVLSFTSCLSDEENDVRNKQMTPAERVTAYNTVRGSYNGKMKYFKYSTDGRRVTDSLNISCEVTGDTTLVLKNIPTSLLVDKVGNDKLKAALSQLPAVNDTCRIGFFQRDPVAFYLLPQSIVFKDLEYDGAKHEVAFVFRPITDSYAVYSSDKKRLFFQLYLAGYYIDKRPYGFASFPNESEMLFFLSELRS